MRLPDPPDLGRPPWGLALSALSVTVIMGVILVIRDASGLSSALGDTDDAMRIVLVRELLGGRGWWDQHLTLLQPPLGVYMHWSRLLDGGIAGMEWIFALFMQGPRAEWMTRLLWPLLWIFPSALAALILADRLGKAEEEDQAPGAVLTCAFFLVSNFGLLGIQYHPGRVDHHDVQMSCCFLALAGAAQRGPGALRGAVLAGAATGLGLAIGLEALVFEALIGAAIALRFVFDERQFKPLKAYGLTLAGVTLAAFCIQTPPWRWGVAACDALASNSTAAVVVAGLAVAAIAQLTKGRSSPIRFTALGLGAVLAAGVYLGLDPRCIKGPFADVDPAIKTIWLSHVKEMQPWLIIFRSKPQDAISYAAPPVMGVLAVIWMGRRRKMRQDSAFRLIVGVFAATLVAGFTGVRMCGYADWIAMPLVAVATADAAAAIARRYRRESLITLIIAGLALTPVVPAVGARLADNAVMKIGKKGGGKPAASPADYCFNTRPYRALAAAGAPGLVLSEIDLGPFILANTKDSVLAAPYHRMSWGMLAARSILAADADNGAAEGKARALGVKYVLECNAHSNHADRDGMSPNALQKRLEQRQNPPAWLERVNPPKSVLEVFRVRPPASSASVPSVARAPGAGR